MPVKIISYSVAVIMFFCALSANAIEGIMTLNYPPDRSVMEFGLLGISVSLQEGSADSVEVIVNEEHKKDIKVERPTVCFSVPLVLGVNTISVRAIKNDQQVDSVSFSAFRRSDLEAKFLNPLYGYQKDYFHMGDNKKCAGCHKLDPTEADLRPVNPATFQKEGISKEEVFAATSTCYSCHCLITEYPYVHGPAAVWSCLSCHDKDAARKYAVKKPDTEICFTCHADQKKLWTTKKYIHGPVNIGKCAICHSPHASENPFNLVKPSWNLCTTCHFEKGTGMHVLGNSMFSKGHPTRNKPDPLRKGKQLSCASCHDPHTSNYPHLWAFDVDSIYDLCQKCHKKK